MIRIFKIVFLLLACLSLSNCNSQNTRKETNTLSNDFDKSMPFYYKMPKKLSSTDTSPAYKENGKKILLTGTLGIEKEIVFY